MIDLNKEGSVRTRIEVERLINRLIADSPNDEAEYWKDAEACIHTYRGITVTITRGDK
jgi:hypothetical protein